MRDDERRSDSAHLRLLHYRPSISVRVYDALFSFWRLPRIVQQRLTHKLPVIRIAVVHARAHADVDWAQLGACLRAAELGSSVSADANPMEIAWAFALQSEAAVSAARVLAPPSSSGTAVLALDITHGPQLARLAALLRDSDGEFYMAFLVLITVLERALYDLYHQHQHHVDTTDGVESTRARTAVVEPKASAPSTSMPRTRSGAGPPSPPKRKKNMILRDLLGSETLARALPDGLLQLLRVLFLPSGLNLRNLVWHGFLTPHDIPKCFGCLLLVLLLALPRARVSSLSSALATATSVGSADGSVAADTNEVPDSESDAEALFAVHTFDSRFTGQDPALRRELDALFGTAPAAASGSGALKHTALEPLCAAATCAGSFVPMGRRGLVQRAFTRLVRAGDELWFLLALLPVLEHAVRVQFVAANGAKWGLSSEYSAAQVDAYYSTLDGFGQRDKHQVLLHARVALDRDHAATTPAPESAAMPSGLNQLYAVLPPAALALCLDLFMMAAGPNLRAKLCHGEANLTTLLQPHAAFRAVSTATQLLVLAWLSLCRATQSAGSTDTSDTATEAPVPRLRSTIDAFERGYRSSFHPFHQLQRALTSAHACCTEFAALRSRWTRFRLDVSGDVEPMVWIEFVSAAALGVAAVATEDSNAVGAATSRVGVHEKTRRIQEFAALLRDDALFVWTPSSASSSAARALVTAASVPAKGSFPELLTRLHATLGGVVEQLTAHFTTLHNDCDGRVSAFLALLGSPHSGAPIVQWSNSEETTEAHLLALSDDDGLRGAACMLEIVASAQRAYASFHTRFLDLVRLVASGSARTNHRRSFVNCVFFLPAFTTVQALSLSLVEHQLVHMYARAEHASSACDTASAPAPLCPNARSFELVQCKLLQFITAFERCAAPASDASGAAQMSSERALMLALEFLQCKAMRAVLAHRPVASCSG